MVFSYKKVGFDRSAMEVPGRIVDVPGWWDEDAGDAGESGVDKWRDSR